MATDKKAETKTLATSLLHIIVAKKGISEKGIQREVANVKASTVRAQLQVCVRASVRASMYACCWFEP